MSPPGARLGQALADLATRSRVAARAATLPLETEIRARAQTAFMEGAERALSETARPLLSRLLGTEGFPDEFKEAFSEAESPTRQWGFVETVAANIGMLLGGIFMLAEPLLRKPLQVLNAEHTTSLPPLDLLAQTVVREGLDPAVFNDAAAAQGFNPRNWELFVRGLRIPPSVGELIELRRRGEIDEGRLRKGLKASGIQDGYIDDVLALTDRLPDLEILLAAARRKLLTTAEARAEIGKLGFSDKMLDVFLAPRKGIDPGGLVNQQLPISEIIRFAAKEVFEPAQRAELGIDAEYPPELTGAFERLGFSESDARDSWAAHWAIPSLGQGFQMLHRGQITEAQLDGLFKAAEIPPRWRKPLTNIAYAPYTRVDLRRLRRAGLISEDEVMRNYLDQGYAPDKAAVLTEFAELDQVSEEREITKGEIRELYEARSLNRDQALGFLTSIGLSDAAAGFVLDIADIRRTRRLTNLATSTVRSQYTRYKISRVEVGTRLDTIGVPPEERDLLLRFWDEERAAREADLSEAQLARALRFGNIAPDEYLERLTELGYTDRDARLLLAGRTQTEGPIA